MSDSPRGQTPVLLLPCLCLNLVNFVTPKSVPSSKYLVRVESIALHQAQTQEGGGGWGAAQIDPSWAQVEVTDGGSGNPGPPVTIPGGI